MMATKKRSPGSLSADTGGAAPVGVKVVARVLGITPRRVQQLVKEGLPQAAKGKYPLVECVHWYIRYWQVRAEGSGVPSGPSPDGHVSHAEARRRKEVALAEMRELELQERLGNLVSLDYMDEQLSDALQRTRQTLNAIPGKIAPLLIGCPTVARAQMLLQQAIDEALPSLQLIGDDDASSG